MTTAHRPTWKAAVGKAQEGGWTAGGAVSTSISALDVAAHTKLKTRRGEQLIDKKKALKESLLALEKAEAKASKTKIGRREVVEPIEAEGRQKLLKQTSEVDDKALRQKYNDDDADKDKGGENDSDGWSDVDRDKLGDPDDSDLADSSSNEDDDSDSDDEDEEAALQAELAKIRAEREAFKAKADAEAEAEEETKLGEAALIGNPLLATGGASGKMKRRWNDDVVFKHQAADEPKLKKRFINDTVRNDFHKRFLNKFIR